MREERSTQDKGNWTERVLMRLRTAHTSHCPSDLADKPCGLQSNRSRVGRLNDR